MTAAALASRLRNDAGGVGAVAIELRVEDRLQSLFTPMRGMSGVMLAVLAGSVALHLALVATAVVGSWTPETIPQQQETPVEVVQEVPKPAPKPPPRVEAARAQAAPKLEPTKPEPSKLDKLEAPKPEALQPAKPVAMPKLQKPADVDQLEALRKEVAALRAEQARLKTADTPPPAEEPTPARASPPAAGTGPLAKSFQAIALPSSTAGEGDAMNYTDIVFSQLAKAKGLGERQGRPGTTGVHFDIDAAGALVAVEIVHPSGVADLDREALAIVRRAAPFPAPPPGSQRSFDANVNFVTTGRL